LSDRIQIQLMDSFEIMVNGHHRTTIINKSRKGMALIQYLIINGGQQVLNQKLLSSLWPEESNSNPVNSLKTLVSRVRAMLNQVSDGLGNCIVADRGAYHWEMMPGMVIDLYEIESTLDAIASPEVSEEEKAVLGKKLLDLYRGDLMQQGDQYEWLIPRATSLHTRYITAMYAYLDYLMEREDYDEIVNTCRQILAVDNFDDKIHMELMSALVKTNRVNEALVQYKHVMYLHYHYLGVQPRKEMQEFYKRIANVGHTLEFDLESIRNELCEGNDQNGAYVCEYSVFKEIFNLQIRNLERLGSAMLLAVVKVSDINGEPMDSMKQESVMNSLMDIMKTNLRKGDTITHFSPMIMALLLPTAVYSSGSIVMERVKKLFYKRYPNSNVVFDYRVGPLRSDAQLPSGTRE